MEHADEYSCNVYDGHYATDDAEHYRYIKLRLFHLKTRDCYHTICAARFRSKELAFHTRTHTHVHTHTHTHIHTRARESTCAFRTIPAIKSIKCSLTDRPNEESVLCTVRN